MGATQRDQRLKNGSPRNAHPIFDTGTACLPGCLPQFSVGAESLPASEAISLGSQTLPLAALCVEVI